MAASREKMTGRAKQAIGGIKHIVRHAGELDAIRWAESRRTRMSWGRIMPTAAMLATAGFQTIRR